MKCPLCTGTIEADHKFCRDCYKRASESLDRRSESIGESEQAVQVALTYLSPMYPGRKPLTVEDNAELVSLAVTISHDLRLFRSQAITTKNAREAMSHLGAALTHSLDTDDQVIMQHVRDAYVLLGGKLEWHASQREFWPKG